MLILIRDGERPGWGREEANAERWRKHSQGGTLEMTIEHPSGHGEDKKKVLCYTMQ